MVPDDLKYTEQHEWIRVDGNVGTVGITDHAQEQLGDITFVELPNEGAQLRQGDEACTVESAKAASSIYAPVGGSVTAVNDDLLADPSLVNSDPYGKGWIYRIELSDPGEVGKLMAPEAYRKSIET